MQVRRVHFWEWEFLQLRYPGGRADITNAHKEVLQDTNTTLHRSGEANFWADGCERVPKAMERRGEFTAFCQLWY